VENILTCPPFDNIFFNRVGENNTRKYDTKKTQHVSNDFNYTTFSSNELKR
jgi:hypothetical protein